MLPTALLYVWHCSICWRIRKDTRKERKGSLPLDAYISPMKHFFFLLLFFLSIALLAARLTVLPPTSPEASQAYRAGELLLKLRPGITLSAQALVSSQTSAQNNPDTFAIHTHLEQTLQQLGAYHAESLGEGSHTYRVKFATTREPPRIAQTLAENPAVVFAEPNYVRHMLRMPDDPNLSQQWALENIHAFEAWDITTGKDIVIAVVDTGVWSSHPDLQGNVLPGYNALLNNDQSDDDHGHGTAIAGLIAARTDNDKGIAGICWDCSILPVKVLNARGTGNDADLARGIRWATDHGAHIINLSLGGAENSQALRDAVDYAFQRGVLLIASSGNDHQLGNFTNYPAAYPQVIAVGATTNSDKVAGFSNTGEHIDLVAPGVALWTTMLDGDYGPPNGTSFSSPFVSGVAGLVLTVRGDLPHTDVACILQASADDHGSPGKDMEYGWGRLNALRAVQMAQNYTGCPLNQPDPEPTPEPQATNDMASPTDTLPDVVSQAFAPVPPSAASQDGVYFPETRHTLRGEFYRYWQKHGGLPVFGYPISEEFLEPSSDEQNAGQTFVVQYFERYRFEFHPEKPAPYNVLLSRLGDDVLTLQDRSWFLFPPGEAQDGCYFFEGTSHSLCGPFLDYWRSHGLELDGSPAKSFGESLALFGQPISEMHQEEVVPGVTLTVQWFERARFEYHEGTGVLLGRLGYEYASMRGVQVP